VKENKIFVRGFTKKFEPKFPKDFFFQEKGPDPMNISDELIKGSVK